MPIYAYRCAHCGHAQDVLQKMSDPLLTTCPVCGAEAYAKQLTAAGFQLKGSGWYVTDFRGGKKPEGESKGGEKADAKPEGAAATPSDAASKPAADSKPAAAAPSPAPAPASPSPPPATKT